MVRRRESGMTGAPAPGGEAARGRLARRVAAAGCVLCVLAAGGAAWWRHTWQPGSGDDAVSLPPAPSTPATEALLPAADSAPAAPDAAVDDAEAQDRAPATPDAAADDAELLDRALRDEQGEEAHALLARFPASDNAVYLAGLILEEQGDSAGAIVLWEKAVALNPARADVHESIGYALMIQEKHEDAAASFRRALAIDPSMARARLRLGMALAQRGEYEEVIAALEGTRGLSAAGLRLLGQAYHHRKEYLRAVAYYQDALRVQPDLAEAYYGLAATYLRMGESEKAAASRERFTALQSEEHKAGRRWRSRFDPLAITRRSVAHTHTDVGRVWHAQGDAAQAERLWRRAATLDPENTVCRYELAAMGMQSGRLQEARAFVEELTRIAPADPVNFLRLADVCVRLGEAGDAQRAYRQVIALAPSRPEGYAALAALLLQVGGDAAESVTLARTAARLAPNAAHWALVCRSCMQAGDRDGALEAIAEAIRLAPADGRYGRLREQLLEDR